MLVLFRLILCIHSRFFVLKPLLLGPNQFPFQQEWVHIHDIFAA